MRAGFNVTFEDETREITVTIPDFIKWSKWAGKPIADIQNSTIEDWVYVMWLADTRTGHTSDDVDTWSARIVDLDRVAEKTPKVTRKAASKGSSSS